MDTPLQKSLSPLLSWIFYALAALLALMFASAFFALPIATSVGVFFFQAFGIFAFYLPLYFLLIGLYLQKNSPNYAKIIAINLTFLPFITLVFLWRFLSNLATTEWEIALFWHVSKNYRNHYVMVFIIVLLMELTLISYFWYKSRTKKIISSKSTEDSLDIDKLHSQINNINTIDNSQQTININDHSHSTTRTDERVLLRVESHLKRSKYLLQETLSKLKVALFGAEKVDKQWQEEVEELLDELKQDRKVSTVEVISPEENKSKEESSFTYLQRDTEIKELLDDPMMENWHKDEEIRPINTSFFEEPEIETHFSDDNRQSVITEPQDPLEPQEVSHIINQHLGIKEEIVEIPDPEEKEPFIPQKLESPQVNVESDFIKSKEQFDEDLLPLHLRDSFFTQEEQDALHAIGEEIIENAEIEEQIAELIEEANQTLDKLITNTHLTSHQSNDIYQKYEHLMEEQKPSEPVNTASARESEIFHTEIPNIMENLTPATPAQEENTQSVSAPDGDSDSATPFVHLEEPTEEEILVEESNINAFNTLEVPALPSIKEDLEHLEFIQQSLIESELESAIDSPTTAVEIANYQLPHATLLHGYEETPYWEIDEETEELASILENTLKEFKIEGKVTNISKGPAITMFELLPASGVKLSRIEGLADNIAFRLAAKSVRIVAPIPGKQAVGVEIPNKHRAIVSFKELIDDTKMHDPREIIPVVLGKDIAGDNQVIDLTKTPHLLIAGATGSGKSVSVNALISSILFTRKPTEVRMMLIDPKVVELKPFNDVPHLLTPVITDPKRALQAIAWVNDEMDRRYALLDNLGVRNIAGYNTKIKEMHLINPTLPYLVVVIDEFADLMATSAKELEGLVARLAAKSRAAGIHLVLATQRPSVDVITGLIKANFPSRIAFMVAGKMDSRVILDTNGAEQLLGKGDMLFISSWGPIPTRIQGAFLSDEEVESIADFVKSQGEPNYIDDEIFYDEDEQSNFDDSNDQDNDDVLYEEAVDVVLSTGKTSASYLQRRFKIGYNRAARLIEMMEDRGLLGPANGSKPREILR